MPDAGMPLTITSIWIANAINFHTSPLAAGGKATAARSAKLVGKYLGSTVLHANYMWAYFPCMSAILTNYLPFVKDCISQNVIGIGIHAFTSFIES